MSYRGDVESIMQQATHQRNIERGADSLLLRIRLREKGQLVKTVIRFWQKNEICAELNANETSALYLALQQVRNKAADEADRLEQSLTVKDKK